MAPKRNPPLRRAAAKAKAAALALRVSTSNARRDRRRNACRALNQLANELGVGQAAVDAKGASGAEVDRFTRLLERRVLSDGQLDRLRAIAKAFADNGGELSSEVVCLRGQLDEPLRPEASGLGFFLQAEVQGTGMLPGCQQGL